MTTDRSTEYLTGLMREMCKLPRETEWVEFKAGNDDPEEIGGVSFGAGELSRSERKGFCLSHLGRRESDPPDHRH